MSSLGSMGNPGNFLSPHPVVKAVAVRIPSAASVGSDGALYDAGGATWGLVSCFFMHSSYHIAVKHRKRVKTLATKFQIVHYLKFRC